MKPAYAKTKRRTTSPAKAAQLPPATPADIWKALSGQQQAVVTTFEPEEPMHTRHAVMMTLVALGLAAPRAEGHVPTRLGLQVRDYGRIN